MKNYRKLGYLRPESSFEEFEITLCQSSTTAFEDDGTISGEWE